MNKKARSQLQH